VTLFRARLVPPRHPGPEWIDGGDVGRADWEKALGEIGLVNRFLGGTAPIHSELRRLARRKSLKEVSLLDVGTGGADIPSSLRRKLARDGIALRAAGCDLDPEVARVAHGNGGVDILRCDAFRLPFPEGSFDVVTASLFFHHFTEREGVALLMEFQRVAARLVIVNDLARHKLAWLLIRAIGAVAGASPLFRHDAPLSVLRGFTVEELARMAGSAGLDGRFRIERRWAFRLLLVVEKGTA